MDELFLRVAERLDAIGIPYMLSGSVAMGFYTIPRMTRDVDIVIEMNVGEVETFGIFTFTNPAYWKRRSGKGCST